MRENTKKIIFIASFVLLFFAVRLHFYRFPLTGEEGAFANIFVNQTHGPEFLQQGRSDGEDFYGFPRHPETLYNSLRIAGIVCSPIIKQVPYTDDMKITPVLRLLFSLFQFFILLGIGAYLCSRKKPVNILLALLLLAVAVSPTAIKTSVRLQIDGGVGILMNALFAAALLFIAKSDKRTFFRYVLLFCATFYLAAGKQEWSIILLTAIFAVGMFLLFTRLLMRQQFNHEPKILAIIIVGIIAGNICSYLIGPVNYMGAFGVIRDFSRIENVASNDISFMDWVRLRSSMTFWICTIIALITLSSIFVLQNIKKIRPPELLIWIYGLGLFGAFFFSKASLDPRHFAPSLIILTFAVIALFPKKTAAKTFAAISIILFAMFASTGLHLFVSNFVNPIRPHFDPSTLNLKADEIAILSPAQAWNKTDIDFINHFMGKRGVEDTAKKLNKKLYPPDYAWPEKN
ncbi:MAG: hypothetical protein FVQ82_03330 [Planctomycetes bacterium]|nr:hypothetical protein [Planctomycetota bacterium]